MNEKLKAPDDGQVETIVVVYHPNTLKRDESVTETADECR